MKDLMTFTEAAQICPGSPDPTTVSRWRRAGIKTRSGVIVRLQCLRSGKQYYTTEKWLREFFNKVAELDQPSTPSPTINPTINPSSARQRLIEEGVL